MAKGKNRAKVLADKRTAKEAKMRASGGLSNYARKRKYLDKHGGSGDSYIGVKPWKTQ